MLKMQGIQKTQYNECRVKNASLCQVALTVKHSFQDPNWHELFKLQLKAILKQTCPEREINISFTLGKLV